MRTRRPRTRTIAAPSSSGASTGARHGDPHLGAPLDLSHSPRSRSATRSRTKYARCPVGSHSLGDGGSPVSIEFSGALSSPRGRAGERVPRRRGSEARGGPPAKWREAHTKRGSPVVTAHHSPGCGPGGHFEAEKPGGARLCDRVRGGTPSTAPARTARPRGRTRSMSYTTTWLEDAPRSRLLSFGTRRVKPVASVSARPGRPPRRGSRPAPDPATR